MRPVETGSFKQRVLVPERFQGVRSSKEPTNLTRRMWGQMVNTVRKVAIIGAGMTGLTVAHRLKLSGCEVHVFDKGRRPGGARFDEANIAGHL